MDNDASVAITGDGSISLAHGEERTVTVSVVAPDGISTRDYTVRILSPSLTTPSLGFTETSVEVPERGPRGHRISIPVTLSLSSPLPGKSQVEVSVVEDEHFNIRKGSRVFRVPARAVSFSLDVKATRKAGSLSEHAFHIEIKAVDGAPYHVGPNNTVKVTLTDRSAPPTFENAPDTNLTIAKGESVSIALPKAEDGFRRIVYTTNDLPPGLRLDRNDNTLVGTSRHGQGRKTYVIQAKDRDGETDLYAFTLRITSQVSFDEETLPDQTYVVNEAITAITLPEETPNGATLDILPSRGSRLDPDLPAGLEYSIRDNTISGTPRVETEAAKFTVVRKLGKDEDTTTFHITVLPIDIVPPVITKNESAPDKITYIQARDGAIFDHYSCVDARDGTRNITADLAQLDVTTPGDQTLTLSCSDTKGNVGTLDITIDVEFRTPAVENLAVTSLAQGAGIGVSFTDRQANPRYPVVVEYRKTGETAWITTGVNLVSTGDYEITGLDQNSEYEVRIYKNDQDGVLASAIETGSAYAIPVKPDVSAAESINNGSPSATVTLNTSQSGVTSYRIAYEITFPAVQKFEVLVTTQELTDGVILDLIHNPDGDNLNITVVAVGTDKDSEPVVLQVTPYTTPAKAKNVAISEITFESVKVSWENGDKPSNAVDITGYQVRWSKDGLGWQSASLAADADEYEIEDLDSNTKYTIEVIALSPLNHANINQPTVQTTVTTLPIPAVLPVLTPNRVEIEERGIRMAVTYEVTLASPDNSVILVAGTSASSATPQTVVTDKTRLVFTESNWDVPQEVIAYITADAGLEDNAIGILHQIEGMSGTQATVLIDIDDQKDTSIQQTFGDLSINDLEVLSGVTLTGHALPIAFHGGAIDYQISPALPEGLRITDNDDKDYLFAIAGTPVGGLPTTEYTWTAASPGFNDISLTFDITVEDTRPYFEPVAPADDHTVFAIFRLGTPRGHLYPKAKGGVGDLTYTMEPLQSTTGLPPGVVLDMNPDGHPRVHGRATDWSSSFGTSLRTEPHGNRKIQLHRYNLVATDAVGQKAELPVFLLVEENFEPAFIKTGEVIITGSTNTPMDAQLPLAESKDGSITYSIDKQAEFEAIGLKFDTTTAKLTGTPINHWHPRTTVDGVTREGWVKITARDWDGSTVSRFLSIVITKDRIRVVEIRRTDADDQSTWRTHEIAHNGTWGEDAVIPIAENSGGGAITYALEGDTGYNGHGDTITSTLPDGLTFNTSTGEISGTVTDYDFSIMRFKATATDATYGDEARIHFIIKITGAAFKNPSDSYISDMTLVVGQNYSVPLPMLWRDGEDSPLESDYALVRSVDLPKGMVMRMVDGKLRLEGSPTEVQAKTKYEIAHRNHHHSVAFTLTTRNPG